MPDLLQEFIPNIPRLGAVFALYPLCFKVFAWIEDRLSINAKAEISAWLKSTGDFATNQIFSVNLSRSRLEISNLVSNAPEEQFCFHLSHMA